MKFTKMHGIGNDYIYINCVEGTDRGETVEEALMELDQFLDNCVMANQSQVTIIHGKGTGALRKAVQQHLKHHPSVKSFRLGVFGEGESGVTIVELK